MTFSVLSHGSSLCVPQALSRAHNNSDSNRPYRYEDSFPFGKETTTVTTSGNNNNNNNNIIIINIRQQQCFCKDEYQTNPANRRVYIDFYCKILYNIYVGKRLEKDFAIMFYATFISHFGTQLQKALKLYPIGGGYGACTIRKTSVVTCLFLFNRCIAMTCSAITIKCFHLPLIRLYVTPSHRRRRL